jgi:RNA polymerase sigma factor (sigma-70 family)
MPPPAESLASRLFLTPALRTQPDRRLVALVREGYESAFEEIVRRYARPLGRYAASIVGARSEDVLQDAFAKALPALCRDDAEIELRPWLFRIVRNTALNELRDNPPSTELLAETLAGGGNPAESLERREQLADLIRRLQALPPRQRAAIVMRELEGLGHAEIAAALGLSGGAARQAIHRARQALRDGAGMLLPLPLLKALMGSAGPASIETAAGAGATGVGAGVALKATAASVFVAGAVGAGVALHAAPRSSATDPPAPPARSSAARPEHGPPAPTLLVDDSGSGGDRSPAGSGGDRHGPGAGNRGRGENRGRGSSGGGEDRGTHRVSGDGSHDGGDRSGPGPGHEGSGSGSGSGSGDSGRKGGDSGDGGASSKTHDSSGPGPGLATGGHDSGSGDGGESGSGDGSSGTGTDPIGSSKESGDGDSAPLESGSGSSGSSDSSDLRDSGGGDGLSG